MAISHQSFWISDVKSCFEIVQLFGRPLQLPPVVHVRAEENGQEEDDDGRDDRNDGGRARTDGALSVV